MGNKPYKTNIVKTQYLEDTIDIIFDIMQQRGCDIRDISQVDIYKKGRLNRKTFANNYHGIGGIHLAAANEVKRHSNETIGIKADSTIELSEIILMRFLTVIKSK